MACQHGYTPWHLPMMMTMMTLSRYPVQSTSPASYPFHRCRIFYIPAAQCSGSLSMQNSEGLQLIMPISSWCHSLSYHFATNSPDLNQIDCKVWGCTCSSNMSPIGGCVTLNSTETACILLYTTEHITTNIQRPLWSHTATNRIIFWMRLLILDTDNKRSK